MSMAFPGLTHCRKCYSPLNMNEFGICKSCEEKEKKEEELYKQEKEKKEREKLEKEKQIEFKNIMREQAVDIMKEFREVMAESKSLNNENTATESIDISTVKPEDMDFTNWYSSIGYRVIEAYLKGNKKIKINFIEGE